MDEIRQIDVETETQNLENQFVSLLSRYDEASIAKIEKARNVAKTELSDIFRDTGETSYMHSLRVAIIAIEEVHLGAVSIIAALLHEVNETKADNLQIIERDFGKDVAFSISEMQKISRLKTEKLSLNSENYISLVLSITSDVRVILLKLADSLEKVRTIKGYTPSRQLKIAQEVRLLYGPIAHRLGLYSVKTEMEDISLKYIEPEMYFSIARQLKDTKAKREQYIQEFKNSINETLQSRGYTYEIKGRPKSVNSIYNKIKNQHVDLSGIYDLFAIRVILDNVPPEQEKDACWSVYSIITNIYTPNPKRLRDWITTPRPSGYESLHTTVIGPGQHWVEVQIRTRRMDEIAEKGNAAHWKYKETGKDKDLSHDEWLRNIRDILEQKDHEILDNEMNQTSEVKSQSIFVFTPQGDIIKLHAGATVLDFAYSIHSNLGNTCTGARVNGAIVNIRYQPQNGETLEVLTSKTQKPKLEWLDIAVSTRVKQRIRRAINEEMFGQAEMGKEILERKVSQLKLEFNDQLILKMTTHFKYKRALDFYQDIADEKIDVQAIREYLINGLNAETEQHVVEEPKAGEFVQQDRESHADGCLIIDKDLNNVDFKLARCCHPIPGDSIFGFVTVDRGIQIHRQGCPNAKDLFARFPYRIVKARWNNDDGQQSFETEMIVTGVDRVGIVNHISEVITKSDKVNLRSININSRDGIFKANISVLINSVEQLDVLLANISKIKGVLKAARSDKF
ncbi:MAG: RelA/SpoT family protein [Salinivirgaceae bacterium]|nr:RelA/SpoT family protein [Salinivirgaceae bacterium]